MEQNKEKVDDGKYLEVPCANCGEHYWRIVNKEGRQILKCPKCRKKTDIQIGKELNIYYEN